MHFSFSVKGPAFGTLGFSGFKVRPLTRVLARGLIGALIIALSSRVSVTFAQTVVPFTLQPQAVLCVAAYLGPIGAMAAVFEYLLAGASGLPVFAGGLGGAWCLVGPTAGFLWSYVLAAPLVASVARARWEISLLGFILASAMTLFCGALGLLLFFDAKTAYLFGVAPFWFVDLVKAILSFVVYRLGILRFSLGADASSRG